MEEEEDQPFEAGIDEGRGVEAVDVDVDVEWALSGCVEDSMSPKSCYGCIHWDHSMIAAVACPPGPVWTRSLRLNPHFLLGRLQEDLSLETGQNLGEDDEGGR